MDVVGTISSAIDLVQKVRNHIQNIKDEQAERSRLLSEVIGLATVLPALQKRIGASNAVDDPSYPAAFAALGAKNGPLDNCRVSLEVVNKKLEPGQGSATKKLGQKMLWPFKLTDIKDELARMERFKTLVLILLQSNDFGPFVEEIKQDMAVVMGDLSDVKQTVHELKQGQDRLLSKVDDEARHGLANWISALNMTPPNVTATQGTGQAFLKSAELASWLVGEFRCLWCPGNAGAGKTTLMTIVIPYLEHRFLADPSRTTLHFYFNYQSTANVTRTIFLEYLLKRLMLTRALTSTVSKLSPYRDNSSRPPESEIISCLQAELTSYDCIFFLVDALDESPGNLSTALYDFLVNILPENVSFLFTSRDIPEVSMAFLGEKRLDIITHESDLRMYIESCFEGSPKLCRVAGRAPSPGQEAITSKVLEKAQGMFLLGRLLMEQLLAQSTPNALVKTLETLPRTLDEMYRVTLERSPDPARALRILSWVCLAHGRLTLEDLRYAIAWRVDATTVLDPGDLDDEESLLSSCVGLLVTQNDGPLPHVTFIHYTTQEYVIKLSRNPPPGILSHSDITALCLTYMRYHLPQFQPGISIAPPLLDYCVHHWHRHAKCCQDNTLIQELALAFMMDETQRNLSPPFYPNHVGIRLSPLYLASSYGLHVLIDELYLRAPETLNSSSASLRTPLDVACVFGHEQVVSALLAKEEVNLNLRNFRGQTPLSVASEIGVNAIVQRLLAHPGVQVNAQDDAGMTALIHAVRRRNMDVIKALLCHPEVDVNAKDFEGKTALIHAAGVGDLESVEMLLGSPKYIDVGIRDTENCSALSEALKGGFTEIVRVLLPHLTEDEGAAEMLGKLH